MNNKEPVNIAFFDSKPYDIAFFTEANKNFLYNIEFLEPNLNRKTAVLAKGAQVVCAFVNDKLDKETLDILYNEGIRLVVMRCAGYNNVDLEAAYGKITILRVPLILWRNLPWRPFWPLPEKSPRPLTVPETEISSCPALPAGIFTAGSAV